MPILTPKKVYFNARIEIFLTSMLINFLVKKFYFLICFAHQIMKKGRLFPLNLSKIANPSVLFSAGKSFQLPFPAFSPTKLFSNQISEILWIYVKVFYPSRKNTNIKSKLYIYTSIVRSPIIIVTTTTTVSWCMKKGYTSTI